MTEKTTLFNRDHTDHDRKTNTGHDRTHDDDDQDDETLKEGGGSGVGGCRWNPTKEQIEMLESIYNNEGVRTPSADQIQQITARLRVYGHIEGKNVFYWFQNHKARQRQKQRQERLAAANLNNNNLNYQHHHLANYNISRFVNQPLQVPLNNNHYHSLPNYGINNGLVNPMLHHNYSNNYLPNPNVMCSTYYNHPLHSPQFHYSAPPPDHHHHHHHHALINRLSPSPSPSPSPKHVMQQPRGGGVSHGSTLTGHCGHGGRDHMMTLDLFPVHPTGILEHKFDMISTNNYSATNSSGGSSSPDSRMSGGEQKEQMFYDFFSTDHVFTESD
ncbi:hypothetical protein vseg_010066 [Gypsophila vaccaria]